jgi:hypothetical protein
VEVRPNHQRVPVYGPFYRLRSETQDEITVAAQIVSGEVWGRVPRWGLSPAVEAYPGSLPVNASGVEFFAFAAPDRPWGPRSHWSISGQYVTIDASNELAKLSVAFVRITPGLIGIRP